MVRGAVAFLLSSLVVFGTVAGAGGWMYRNLTEAGAYTVWALLFIILSNLLLSKAFRVPIKSFAGLFTAAFIAYTLGWCAAWFASPNRTGEIVATILGPLLMAATVVVGCSAKGQIIPVSLALVTGHTVGYFLGSLLHDALGPKIGMVLWGVAYGLGFGAGMGYAASSLLKSKHDSSQLALASRPGSS